MPECYSLNNNSASEVLNGQNMKLLTKYEYNYVNDICSALATMREIN